MSDGSPSACHCGAAMKPDKPVMEVVLLKVRDASVDSFEAVMQQALAHLRGAAGYGGHTCGPCVEEPGLFVLVIHWRSLQAHTVDFRGSAQHEQWHSLLAPHIDPEPSVRHFEICDLNR